MRFVLSFALLITASTDSAQDKKAVLPRQLPGGGVADAAGKWGYVPNPAGGIDALDLTSGKLLWSSPDANHPLLAIDGRLFARKHDPAKPNVVRVVVLDAAQNGKRVLESQAITFPDWVSIGVSHGRTFRDSARFESGQLSLIWDATAFYAGGAAPPPEVEQAARKAAAGVVAIDLKDGTTKSLDQAAAAKFFPFTNEVGDVRIGETLFSLKDGPPAKMRNPIVQRRQRFLTASTAAGNLLWEHEIAGTIFLLPRP